MRTSLVVLLFLAAEVLCEPPLYRGDSNFLRLSAFQPQQQVSVARGRRETREECSEEAPNQVDTGERLAELRAEMAAEGADAYIVPKDEEGRLAWISGFSGSAGQAIITADQAALWTDGRYFLQADDQIDCNWELMRSGQPEVPTYAGWLLGAANLSAGSQVGADPSLIGASTWLDMAGELEEGGLGMKSIADNLVDRIWTEEDGREPFTPKDLVVHSLEYAGQDYKEKLVQLRSQLSEGGFSAMVLTEGDEIAWLLNLRGEGTSTVESLYVTPTFQSTAIVEAEGAVKIWAHTEKVTEGVREHLGQAQVEIREYNDTISDLSAWASSALDDDDKILLTKASMYLTGASYAVYEALPEEAIELADSPVLKTKSIKNQVEADGMVTAHLRDAYACCRFFAELENDITKNGAEDWTELSAAARLAEIREEQDLNRGYNFPSIAASGTNGALIHYLPEEDTNAKVNKSALFLVDSGGQYLDGTTDVTRTFFYGSEPDPEWVDRYTRVLMGKIDLARAVFPDGTLETALDYATRQHLFNAGLDYNHGTGHGIGAYLSVHEGPVNIRMSEGSIKAAPIRENMFISDEPGYYKDCEYGIRLESIVQVVRKEFPEKPEETGFLTFDTITLVPFEPSLIDFSLMNREQVQWYNEYNARILEQVVPHFEDLGDNLTLDWIYSKTGQVEFARKAMLKERTRKEL